ncbi:MAG: hypothetical protein FWE69_00700 [Clostridiales bacterium]|nr:hypothetical protein [Clostridiales bacterium]
MHSNNTGENIVKAFKVVYSTLENVQNLIFFLQSKAKEKGDYISCVDGFVRFSGDTNYFGWAYSSFILIFKQKPDTKAENSGPCCTFYIAEINLHDNNEALLTIARFDYDVRIVRGWGSDRFSTGDRWRLFDPLYKDLISYEKDGPYEIGYVKKENEKKADKDYWGLRRVTKRSFPLMDITADNACDIVFGGFDELAKIEVQK